MRLQKNEWVNHNGSKSAPRRGQQMALKDHAPVWDDQRFIDRCWEAADQKGWSLTMLCQQAGIADNYLVRSPAHGRNIASIILLAKAADKTLGWMLEIPPDQEVIKHKSKQAMKNLLESYAVKNLTPQELEAIKTVVNEFIKEQ